MLNPRFPFAVPYQLKGTAGTNPAYAASGQINFLLDTLPLLWKGSKVMKLMGLQFDIVGTAHSGATGTAIKRPMDDVILAMIDNLEIHGATHGTQVRQDAYTGVTIPIIEELASGGERVDTQQLPLLAAATVQGFKTSFFIPLCDQRGPAPENEAIPTLFWQAAEVLINFAPTGRVVDAGANTLTIDTANIRCTAWCVPSGEITMGPVFDAQLFQSTAVAGSDEVSLQNLGGRTGIEGTGPDAALVDMLILTNAWAQASGAGGADTSVVVGSFDAADLTQFSCAFLDMDQSQDFQSLFSILPRAMGKAVDIRTVWTGGSSGTLAGYVAPRSGFPWCLLSGTVASAGDQYTGLKAIAFSAGSKLYNNTKARVVAGTQVYKRTITGGATGTDTTLCTLKRAFTEEFLAQAKLALLQSGIVRAVIGDENVDWEPLGAMKGPVVPAKQGFIPRRLAPPNPNIAAGR